MGASPSTLWQFLFCSHVCALAEPTRATGQYRIAAAAAVHDCNAGNCGIVPDVAATVQDRCCNTYVVAITAATAAAREQMRPLVIEHTCTATLVVKTLASGADNASGTMKHKERRRCQNKRRLGGRQKHDNTGHGKPQQQHIIFSWRREDLARNVHAMAPPHFRPVPPGRAPGNYGTGVARSGT